MIRLPQTWKRTANRVRGYIADPLPRDHVLGLDEVTCGPDGICIRYDALGRQYRIRVTLPDDLIAAVPNLSESVRIRVLTTIGVAFAPFLFKLSDFKRIDVRTVGFDVESRRTLEEFLVGGLGEFRYRQGLNPIRPISVSAKSSDATSCISSITSTDKVVLLNGGGKDTIVAAELLKAGQQDFVWLTIRPNSTKRSIVRQSGVMESIEVDYEIDSAVEAHRAYIWGHFPFSAVLLSIGLLVALLKGCRYVAAGNEFSASAGNLKYKGVELNHQYTKSYKFERDFASYVNRYITPDIHVFSILRPFHDLQLAELFSKQTIYFPHFVSCNVGMNRDGRWCNACAKCAFTALALYPFITIEQMDVIFGEDPLRRPVIRRSIIDLVSGSFKPWECVGTKKECQLALRLLLDRYPALDFAESPTRRDLESVVDGIDKDVYARQILGHTQGEHNIPFPIVQRINVGLRGLGWEGMFVGPAIMSNAR